MYAKTGNTVAATRRGKRDWTSIGRFACQRRDVTTASAAVNAKNAGPTQPWIMAYVSSFNRTRRPPRIPWNITAARATRASLRNHFGWRVTTVEIQNAIAVIPTNEAYNR